MLPEHTPPANRTGQAAFFAILALVIIVALIIAGLNLGKGFSKESRMEGVKKPLKERPKAPHPANTKTPPAKAKPKAPKPTPPEPQPEAGPATQPSCGPSCRTSRTCRTRRGAVHSGFCLVVTSYF